MNPVMTSMQAELDYRHERLANEYESAHARSASAHSGRPRRPGRRWHRIRSGIHRPA